MCHCRYILFYFICMFLMAIFNYHRLGILFIISLYIFIIIIFIRVWFVNYPQEQIIILMVALDELDVILSEPSGGKCVRGIIILPRLNILDVHPFLHLFKSILLGSLVYGSNMMQLHKDPLNIFPYLSILIHFPSSWKCSHFIVGQQLFYLLHR